MTDFERGQILAVSEGSPATLPYCHHLYNMRRSQEIFSYLIKNRIVGKKFLEFVKVDCEGSIIKMQSLLLSKIEKENTIRPLYLKRDLKS